MDRIIIQHLLKVGQPEFILSGKLVAFPEDVRAEHYLETPFLKNPDAGMHFIKIDAPCRRDNADLVVFFKIRRRYHLFVVRCSLFVIPSARARF
jgi:hypothetical protein